MPPVASDQGSTPWIWEHLGCHHSGNLSCRKVQRGEEHYFLWVTETTGTKGTFGNSSSREDSEDIMKSFQENYLCKDLRKLCVSEDRGERNEQGVGDEMQTGRGVEGARGLPATVWTARCRDPSSFFCTFHSSPAVLISLCAILRDDGDPLLSAMSALTAWSVSRESPGNLFMGAQEALSWAWLSLPTGHTPTWTSPLPLGLCHLCVLPA